MGSYYRYRHGRRVHDYRCEAASLEGFIQQLAVQYITHGYLWYVPGRIGGKDPSLVDEKLIRKFGVDVSSAERSRRKRAGKANVQYLRWRDRFVLCATNGRHDFYEAHPEEQVLSFRRCPYVVEGYSIGFVNRRVNVQIHLPEYQRLKAELLELATRRRRAELEEMVHELPFVPYAPVRRQLIAIVVGMNEARGKAGFERLSMSCIRSKREQVKPFVWYDDVEEAA